MPVVLAVSPVPTMSSLPSSARPFDWPWDTGETIWPCRGCDVWRAELLVSEPDGPLWVREWHAVDCHIWSEVEGLES
jgi:hypothetical protein